MWLMYISQLECVHNTQEATHKLKVFVNLNLNPFEATLQKPFIN